MQRMSRCSQYRVLATDISKSLSCRDASPCHEVVDVPVHQVQEELLVTPVIMQKDMDALSMFLSDFTHAIAFCLQRPETLVVMGAFDRSKPCSHASC